MKCGPGRNLWAVCPHRASCGRSQQTAVFYSGPIYATDYRFIIYCSLQLTVPKIILRLQHPLRVRNPCCREGGDIRCATYGLSHRHSNQLEPLLRRSALYPVREGLEASNGFTREVCSRVYHSRVSCCCISNDTLCEVKFLFFQQRRIFWESKFLRQYLGCFHRSPPFDLCKTTKHSPMSIRDSYSHILL